MRGGKGKRVRGGGRGGGVRRGERDGGRVRDERVEEWVVGTRERVEEVVEGTGRIPGHPPRSKFNQNDPTMSPDVFTCPKGDKIN